MLFSNPGLNKKGRCDVVYDVAVKTPDGNLYQNADFKDLPVCQDRTPPRYRLLKSKHVLGVRIEETDPLGKYEVDAVVRNKVNATNFIFKHDFVVEE